MEITKKEDGDLVVFQLAGSIDTATSPSLEGAVNTAVGGGTKRLIFDMNAVSYVSSAGLRVILLAAKKANAAGGGIAVFGLQAGVQEVFSVSGFGRIVPIVAHEAEARTKLAG